MKRLFLALAVLAPVAALAQTTVVTQPFGAGTSTTAGTITTGGTFQTALAASSNRKGCVIQNTAAGNTLYVAVGNITASTTNSIQVAPGGSFSCDLGNIVITDQIQVMTATTADTFLVLVQ